MAPPCSHFNFAGSTDIEFIRFSRVFTSSDEVARLGLGLPKPKVSSAASQAPSTANHAYEYSLITPEEIHMAITAKQILALMHTTEDFPKTKSTLNLIPKKVDSPLSHEMSCEGWGIHAVQGFSLSKFLRWMGVLLLLHMVFVSYWLLFIDTTDLQNAFVPVGFVITVVGLVVGVPQIFERA
ncbi:hypothetical protein B0J14DRAFT_672109 [Halenospora varia]|nr:hypothetical protein B0J14DRAFT_672109 [Halenospora varia]